jgi:hypothetical protein
VQLSAQYRLFSSIKDQIENLLAGFYEIIPKDLVTIVSDLSAHVDHLLISACSSTNKNLSFSFLARRISMWTNGALQQNTMATQALTQSSFGGGEHSNLSTATRERRS